MAARHHRRRAFGHRQQLAVKAVGQQHRAQMGFGQPDIGHGQPDGARHPQVGEFNPLPVIGIALAGKLGNPHFALLVAHDGLGARAADIPGTAQDVAIQPFGLHALVDVGQQVGQ
ncbi:hypothetical protein D3C87_1636010 [compost metagenome]